MKKAEDLTNQLHEVEQNERKQSQESDVAQCLINEAASMLSAAVKTGDIQTAKIARVMLDSGSNKLNEAMKQLANVRACKEKLQGKLMKAKGQLFGSYRLDDIAILMAESATLRLSRRPEIRQYRSRVTCALLARHKPNSQQHLHNSAWQSGQTTQNSHNYLKDGH